METVNLLECWVIKDVAGLIESYLILKDRSLLDEICYIGYYEMALNSIRGHSVPQLDKCLVGACGGGHLELAMKLVELGASDYSNGLIEACGSDKPDLAEYMISCGYTDMCYAMYEIRVHGSYECAKFLINEGYTFGEHGLVVACRNNNIEFIKLLINDGMKDINSGMLTACKYGHTEIVKLMLEYNACYVEDGLIYAGNIEIAKLMIKHGAKNFKQCIDANIVKDVVDYVLKEVYLLEKSGDDLIVNPQ